MSNSQDPQWGVGNAADAKMFDTTMVGSGLL